MLNSTAVSSVLKPGMIVSTRIGLRSAWYNNIVISSEDNKVCLSLIDSYLENMIMTDIQFSAKCTNEFFEYSFEGIIIDINPRHPRSVTFFVKKAEELVNTRYFPRYDSYLAATLKSEWDDTSHFCIINNICLNGMAFICKREFDTKEEYEADVIVSDKNLIHAKGKITRKAQKNSLISYSMLFNEISPKDSSILSRYLSSLDEKYFNLKTAFLAQHVNLK